MTKEPPSLREVSELEFVVEHTIQAPPKRIFEAYTKRDLVAQWWAQPGQTLRVDEMDVRPGGKWRFTHILNEGEEMAMHGEYREIVPVTRLSYTFNWGEGNDSEILAIVDLKAIDDGTRITLTNRCTSREQRDAIVKYGAERGAKAAWERLADLLQRDQETLRNIRYTTLFVTDQDRALDFYTNKLGFKLRGDDPSPAGRFIVVGLPGQDFNVALWPGTPGDPTGAEGPKPGHVVVGTDDCDAAFDALSAKGVRFETDRPLELPFGKVIIALDPDGNRIQITQAPVDGGR